MVTCYKSDTEASTWQGTVERSSGQIRKCEGRVKIQNGDWLHAAEVIQ